MNELANAEYRFQVLPQLTGVQSSLFAAFFGLLFFAFSLWDFDYIFF